MEIVMRVNVHTDKDDVLRYKSITALSSDNGKVIFDEAINRSVTQERHTDYDKQKLHSLLLAEIEYFRDTALQMINEAWGGTGDE